MDDPDTFDDSMCGQFRGPGRGFIDSGSDGPGERTVNSAIPDGRRMAAQVTRKPFDAVEMTRAGRKDAGPGAEFRPLWDRLRRRRATAVGTVGTHMDPATAGNRLRGPRRPVLRLDPMQSSSSQDPVFQPGTAGTFPWQDCIRVRAAGQRRNWRPAGIAWFHSCSFRAASSNASQRYSAIDRRVRIR